MKFWKFEYEGPAELEKCVSTDSLPSPERQFSGLKNTYAHPLKSMKIGDGVVLASLAGDQGKIFAVGKVRAAGADIQSPQVQWAVTTKTVFPDAKGGLANWQTKTAFEISPEPAKRYGLEKLINYYVRDQQGAQTIDGKH